MHSSLARASSGRAYDTLRAPSSPGKLRDKKPRLGEQLLSAKSIAKQVAASFFSDSPSQGGISSESVTSVRQRINSSASDDMFSVGAQTVVVIGAEAAERTAFCEALAGLLGGRALSMRTIESAEISARTEVGVMLADSITEAKLVPPSTRLNLMLEGMRTGTAPFVVSDFLMLEELERTIGKIACVLELASSGGITSSVLSRQVAATGRQVVSLPSSDPAAAVAAARRAGVLPSGDANAMAPSLSRLGTSPAVAARVTESGSSSRGP